MNNREQSIRPEDSVDHESGLDKIQAMWDNELGADYGQLLDIKNEIEVYILQQAPREEQDAALVWLKGKLQAEKLSQNNAQQLVNQHEARAKALTILTTHVNNWIKNGRKGGKK